jgi:hypothetical protein
MVRSPLPAAEPSTTASPSTADVTQQAPGYSGGAR